MIKLASILVMLNMFSVIADGQSYRLTSNGKNVEVLEQNTAPLSNGLSTYKYARVTYLGDPLSLEVEAEQFDFGNDDWDISPHSYQIDGHKVGNKLSFTIDRPGYLVIKFSKDPEEFKKRLVIFIEEPINVSTDNEIVDIISTYDIDNTGSINETVKIQRALDDISGTDKVLYFGDGVYKTSMLQLKSNSKIHLSKEAVIKADPKDIESYKAKKGEGMNRFIYIANAENIEVSGLGTFDGSGSEILGVTLPKAGDKRTKVRLMFILRSTNISFDGIVLKDAASWNTHIMGSTNISFKNCKLMNNTMNNDYFGSLDGWDPDASQKVLIEDCFGWAGDDNVAVKCTGSGNLDILDDVSDVTVRGCVFMTKKTSLKIGTETRCANYRSVIFEDNDVIEADRVLGVNVRDRAVVSDIVFRNIRSESLFPDRRQMPINVYITRREDDQAYTGKIANVFFEDCTFEMMFPQKIQISRIESHTERTDLNVTFKNLTIAGNRVVSLDPTYFNLDKTNGIIKFQ
ncbi:MAG: glycosyl hydrolase family 28 protein [Bacteroidota bacterium]